MTVACKLDEKKAYRRPTCFHLNRRRLGRRWIGSCSVLYNSGKFQHLEAQMALQLTGNDPLANGSNSVTRITLSVARGGTTFAGGTVTSSYPCRTRLVCQLASGRDELTSFSSLRVPIGSIYLLPNCESTPPPPPMFE